MIGFENYARMKMKQEITMQRPGRKRQRLM